jgi:preprotein translocase subunit YajC
MLKHSFLFAIGGSPANAGEGNPLAAMFPMVLIFLVFYFVAFRPKQAEQARLEKMVTALKPGDRVIINPGIFAVVVSVENDSMHVRVDDKTKIRVLKSAVAGLQDQTSETEKK